MTQPTAPTILPNGLPATLSDLERDSWRELVLAPRREQGRSSQSGFSTMTVATNTPDGADARTVVLRKVDAVRRYIWFHTDARAGKVMQLEAYPNATLLFWDDERQVQIRLVAETRLHTNDHVADQQWRDLWVGSRKTYLSERVPGSELPGPYPGFPISLGETLPTEADSEAGRKNFAVIECRVLSMEYLHLGRSGQTRARFEYEPARKLTWLAP